MDKKTIDYFDLYNKLYSIGYHSKLKNHGQKYAKFLCNMYQFDSILEIGCSNGMAVMRFLKRGKLAYGVDVSEIAVRYAAEIARVPNCIIASADKIPFTDKFIDAIFSCDVFEHMVEADIHMALEECRRLSKKYLFLILDCEIERNREWIDKAKEKFPKEFNGISNLHLTIWNENKWIANIQQHGFRFVKNFEELYVFEVNR